VHGSFAASRGLSSASPYTYAAGDAEVADGARDRVLARGLRGRARMRTDNGQGTMNDNAGLASWAGAWARVGLTGGNELRAYHYRRRTR
jgi:hypothetical protein